MSTFCDTLEPIKRFIPPGSALCKAQGMERRHQRWRKTCRGVMICYPSAWIPRTFATDLHRATGYLKFEDPCTQAIEDYLPDEPDDCPVSRSPRSRWSHIVVHNGEPWPWHSGGRPRARSRASLDLRGCSSFEISNSIREPTNVPRIYGGNTLGCRVVGNINGRSNVEAQARPSVLKREM